MKYIGAFTIMLSAAPMVSAIAQSCPAIGAPIPTVSTLAGGVDPTTGAYTPSVANGGISAPIATTPATDNGNGMIDTPPAPPAAQQLATPVPDAITELPEEDYTNPANSPTLQTGSYAPPPVPDQPGQPPQQNLQGIPQGEGDNLQLPDSVYNTPNSVLTGQQN